MRPGEKHGRKADRRGAGAAKGRSVLELREMVIRKNMELVVLAYLLEEPRTGQELIDDIRDDTGIDFSPGRVYPFLYELKRQGVLTTLGGPRRIVYIPADRARARGLLLSEINLNRIFLESLEKMSKASTDR